MNIGALWPTLVEAKVRVLEMQTKLHQWAAADSNRRFDDLYNLAIKRKVKTITRQSTNNALSDLLRQLNAVLRGWTNYFRHGVSSDTFGSLAHYTWWRVVRWLHRKHRPTGWKKLRARFLRYDGETWARDGTVELFNTAEVAVTRYRYRGDIRTPWTRDTADAA